MHDRLCVEFEDVKVAATGQAERRGWNARVRRLRWKWEHLGWRYTIELLSGVPLQRLLLREDTARLQSALGVLPRPVPRGGHDDIVRVESVNGPDAVAAIASLRPDVIIQAGAGLLKPSIFELPTIATLNVHNGIAPLIKGNYSVYWSLLERRPEWLGATVHIVDSGIDTGRPIAYYRPTEDGDEVSLEIDVTRGGVDALIEALHRLERGEEWEVPIPPGEGTYRSTVSGWRLLTLRLRRIRSISRKEAGRAEATGASGRSFDRLHTPVDRSTTGGRAHPPPLGVDGRERGLDESTYRRRA